MSTEDDVTGPALDRVCALAEVIMACVHPLTMPGNDSQKPSLMRRISSAASEQRAWLAAITAMTLTQKELKRCP